MSKIGEKLIPLLSELVKSIGCELVEEDLESDFICFIDRYGRHFELDANTYRGKWRLILYELERPYIEHDNGEINASRVLYNGDIHSPDSINKVRELIQFDDKRRSN